VEALIPISEDRPPAEAAATPLASADRPIVAILAAIVAVHLAAFAYVVAAGLVRRPYSDMFDFLRAEFDFERTRDLIAYLASPHNYQHLIWVRILTALDVQVFHGTATIFAVAASLSVLLGAAVVAFEMWRSTPRRVVGAIGAALAAMLIVSTVNAMDCTQPINAVYALALGFATLAVALFEHVDDSGSRAILLGALALLAGLGAAAGSAAGVAVFPPLIVSAARHRGSRSLLIPTLLVGGAAMAVVAMTLLAGGDAPKTSGNAAHIRKMAEYFLAYAGMPWSSVRLLSRLRLALGLVTVGLAAWLLLRGSRRAGAAGRLERIGLDLILFALITAALAAVGRVDENVQVIVPVRYAVFMSALQAGVICVLAPPIAERWERLRRYIVPAALAGALALLAQQAAAGASAIKTSRYIEAEIAAFDAGARRPEMHQLIFPDLAVAAQVEGEYRRRGLYR
jgi:hypothetical protein